MSTLNDPNDLFDSFSNAVYRKDIESYLSLYDENVLIFDTWQQWSYKGLSAWRKMVENWFASLGTDRDRVSFRDSNIHTVGDLAYLTAIARFTAISKDGEELRFLDNRFTLIICNKDNAWKIVHQHTSGPIDFTTMKVLLKNEDAPN
jgi:ketosteroid isomerase-like protein